eukprot:2366895-Pyramimonas_sp.AAC.1
MPEVPPVEVPEGPPVAVPEDPPVLACDAPTAEVRVPVEDSEGRAFGTGIRISLQATGPAAKEESCSDEDSDSEEGGESAPQEESDEEAQGT